MKSQRRRLLGSVLAAPLAAFAQTRSELRSETERSALLIGNAAYSVAPLRNPGNDARLMARTLRELGFRVMLLENSKLAPMLAAMRDWLIEAQAAHTRVFFFAGHGAQLRGRNYVLPVDAELRHEDDLQTQAVNVSDFTDRLARYDRGANLVILDACRNAPFPLIADNAMRSGARTRSITGSVLPGLASAPPARGTLIAYSTAPGSVAPDGEGGNSANSAYSRHLAAQMQVPGLPVEQLFKRVRSAVARDSGNRQVPWESSSLVGDVCLRANEQGQCGTHAASVDLSLAPKAGAR